jgi:hypothetical protein
MELAKRNASKIIILSGLVLLAVWFGDSNGKTLGDMGDRTTDFTATLIISMLFPALAMAAIPSGNSITAEAKNAISAYVLVIAAFMTFEALDEDAQRGPG